MGGRREGANGGTRRRRDTAFARCVWNGHWVRCGRGGLVFLAFARSAARRLGDSAARRLIGSPAQRWERPRNRSHVAARDQTTKPSWGSDAQAELRRIPAFLSMEVSLKKRYYEQTRPRPGVSTPGFLVIGQLCSKALATNTHVPHTGVWVVGFPGCPLLLRTSLLQRRAPHASHSSAKRRSEKRHQKPARADFWAVKLRSQLH